MNSKTFEVCSEEGMLQLGGQLAKQCKPGDLVTLSGDLGAGKTTLVRGMLNALGHKGSVKSPTYTLVEHYALSTAHIYHFDFYRISDPDELEYMGLRDYLQEEAICLVEWPEKAGDMLTSVDIKLFISYLNDYRLIKIIK